MTRTAAKTTELTTHVALKSKAMWTTALVSSSMNPGAQEEHLPVWAGRGRTGAIALEGGRSTARR